MSEAIKDWREIPDDAKLYKKLHRGRPDDFEWTFGGTDGKWKIKSIDKNLNETTYVLPPILNQMINTIREWGRDEVINDIHRVLKL